MAMAINFLDGTVNRDRLELAESAILHVRYPNDVLAGEHGYVDLDALWVHPDTAEPFVDGTHSVMTLQEALEDDYEFRDIARILNFMGEMAVDLTHITTYLDEQTTGTVTKETSQNQPADCPKLRTASLLGLPELVVSSFPIAGIIYDPMTLGFFNDHIADRYGVEATLPPVPVNA